MERFLRIFGRIFDEYGLIFVAAGIAIGLLIALVAFTRRRKAGPVKPKKDKKADALMGEMADMPALDMPGDNIELTMDDDIVSSGASKEIAMEIDLGDDMPNMPPPDQLDTDMAHQFDMDDASMDELDDITIPKVGEAPPPRKSRFFSASWLHRDHSDDPAEVYEDKAVMSGNKKKRESAAECARLAEIERNMLALRELYEAGLIAPEVYALKAREFAAQAH